MTFIAEVTVHIPPKNKQYIRRYGLYASRSRGIWERFPYIVRLAPSSWKEKHNQDSDTRTYVPENQECSMDKKQRKSAWVAFP